jgi:predicted outer membrane protein
LAFQQLLVLGIKRGRQGGLDLAAVNHCFRLGRGLLVQVKAHRDMVALLEVYSKSGDNADLKKWASQTLPHLKEHLGMAEKLK